MNGLRKLGWVMKSEIKVLGDMVYVRTGSKLSCFQKEKWDVAAEFIAQLQEEVVALEARIENGANAEISRRSDLRAGIDAQNEPWYRLWESKTKRIGL